MTDISQWSETRKADRLKMANHLAQEAVEAGAVVAIEDRALTRFSDGSGNPKSREVYVYIEAPGGAHITIEFDGDTSQRGVYVDTWQAPRDGKRWLSPRLGDVNPHHWSKLNRVVRGFPALINIIVCDIAAFRNGWGYLTEDDDQIKDMRARYREQGWRWYGEAA
jgi:hypothetical protein